MTQNEDKAAFVVQLDGSDINHLMKHGTSQVTKSIGPIDVKIKSGFRMYPKFVMENEKGETIDGDVFGSNEE